MKKLYILVILMVMIAGCSHTNEEASKDTNTDVESEDTTKANETDESNEENVDIENEEDEAEDTSENKGVDDFFNQPTNEDVPDLELQVQKIDKEDGITIENSELYSQLNEVIKADPKGGIPNDFSIYPHDLVYNEDGSTSIVFFAINRLHAPIRNIYFELTLGNKNGAYIFEKMPVTLDEEYVGIIKTDSAVPFLIDIYPEDEEIFMRLTEENIDLRLDNYDVELDE
ncbi:hypothetical protein J416_12979 [Gracilibacillus halophilus YIM-C55.5]|uniref:Lipoprotein n=1 Tax=Gracilibacillus halophilus YIM-C55.5 TaxID=1308866 RepID=N4WSA1_9BACI|nr:hypothetical protein [Gracilibacillus halophilus]ENH96041.1 hypothetical protein J416_12979 [Gracilibacillus halophilus YIM-C55.5]